MPTIADIRLDRDKAIAFAQRIDIRTSPDLGYVVKAALCECFGSEHGVRPFRIVDEEGDLRVVGYVEEDAVRQPSKEGKVLTRRVEYLPWSCEKGQVVLLDVLACPLVSVRVEGQGERRTRQVDAAKMPGFESDLAAYKAYFATRLNNPSTGCVVHGAPRFLAKGKFQGLRKTKGSTQKATCPQCRSNAGTSWDKQISRWHCRPCSNIFSNALSIEYPLINAMVPVRVVSADAFARYLREGIGSQKAFGYGSMLPTEVIEELDL